MWWAHPEEMVWVVMVGMRVRPTGYETVIAHPKEQRIMAKNSNVDLSALVAAELARREKAAGAATEAAKVLESVGVDAIEERLTKWQAKRAAVTGWTAWGHITAGDKNKATPMGTTEPLSEPYPSLTELVFRAYGLQRSAAIALLKSVAEATGRWYFKQTDRVTGNGNPIIAFGLRGTTTSDLSKYE